MRHSEIETPDTAVPEQARGSAAGNLDEVSTSDSSHSTASGLSGNNILQLLFVPVFLSLCRILAFALCYLHACVAAFQDVCVHTSPFLW